MELLLDVRVLASVLTDWVNLFDEFRSQAAVVSLCQRVHIFETVIGEYAQAESVQLARDTLVIFSPKYHNL